MTNPNTIVSNCENCGSEIKQWMRGSCITCKFWNERRITKYTAVIDGHMYTLGKNTSGNYRGMAGRRFDIEFFDGRKCTCKDLWSNGTIPECFREIYPDNAQFRKAERCDFPKGSLYEKCWNPTPKNTEEWPSVNQLPNIPKEAA